MPWARLKAAPAPCPKPWVRSPRWQAGVNPAAATSQLVLWPLPVRITRKSSGTVLAPEGTASQLSPRRKGPWRCQLLGNFLGLVPLKCAHLYGLEGLAVYGGDRGAQQCPHHALEDPSVPCLTPTHMTERWPPFLAATLVSGRCLSTWVRGLKVLFPGHPPAPLVSSPWWFSPLSLSGPRPALGAHPSV